MARGHLRDRTGPRGPAWEVRIAASSGPDRQTMTRTVRWTGTPPVTKAEWKFAARKTLADAEKLRTKLLAELDQTGPSHAGPDGTMTVLLNRWHTARTPAWSVATVAEHRRIIDNRLVPHIGKLTVS